jgi:dipeptidase E
LNKDSPSDSLLRLLLLSSSAVVGRGYLDHAEEPIRDVLTRDTGQPRGVVFVAFALQDLDGYARKARERFARMGIELSALHDAADPVRAVASAEAFFVGGGNTFRLLRRLIELRLLEPLRERVLGGAPYLAASAGTNLAGPTIRTTNDMPIVFPPSLDALGLVPFQLNPHYLDPEPEGIRTHMGETREERIRQFHEEPENRAPVIGLREPAWLCREGPGLTLGGGGARLFERDKPARELRSGDEISFLLRN